MLKRRFNGKMLIALGVLLMAVCASAFAGFRAGTWEVNPSAFRYDMSLYFILADKDYEDLDKYEIGAFVDNECRGVAELLELAQGESCLYMRIRSNASEGEPIDFLLRNKETGDTVVLKPQEGTDFLFKSGLRVGTPSEPFTLARFFHMEVKIEGHGSVDVSDGFYKAGSELTLTASPAEGYRFDSWSTGETVSTISLTLNSDVEISVRFVPNKYKLVFEIEGQEFASMDLTCDEVIEAPDAPHRVGYSFSGWNDLPETMPAHDLTVSGSYSVNSYKLVFKIDSMDIYSAEVEYGSPIAAPEAPAKEGYSFGGWGEVPAVMPAHDVEIYGLYSANFYRLSFELDGEEILSENVAYGSNIVAPEIPVREGYSFTGWSELPATMPASDLVVKGTYDVNAYKLTFWIDGDVLFSEELDFGSPVTAPQAPDKTGYTFNGWDDIPGTMPAHDVDIHSTYTINSYRLTFKISDDVILEEELAYGSPIVAPEAPVKIGHTFSGWSDSPATMPAADTVVSGDYAVNTYNVAYKLDGEVAYQAEVTYGAEVPVFDPEPREGYTFSGWGVDIPAVMPAKDLEFNATFDIRLFSIKFRIGGEVVSSDLIPFGTEVVAPEAPAKEGYAFTGWVNCPVVMPADDVVVDGDYRINTYKVTYNIEDMEFMTQEYEYGAPIVAPEAPGKEGHNFSGWGDVPATMPAFDLVFGGTYEDNFYRLTFRLDGIVVYTDDLVFGAPFSAPEAPAKEGYTFNGWGDVPSIMPARNLEFDGSYTVNSYTVTFRIADEVVYSGTLPFGADIIAPEAPAKEGHTFGSWGIVPPTMPASDLEITGDYTVNSYALTYRIGEEDFLTTSIAYGTEIKAPEAPAREGHSFSGWSEIPAVMPANDLVVSGSYAPDTYKLTFRIDDVVVFSGDVLYGTEIQVPEAPARDGHSFAGWGMVPAAMPASDLEFIGTYDINLYRLTYRIDDVDFYTALMPYGSEIVAPEAPARDGHSLLGWSELPATMPANDLVISGTYSINCYKLTFRIGEDVVYSGDVLYGTEILAPDAPAREGYSFSGWGMLPATMPASDLEFVGSYDVNLYTLTFDIDGEVFFQTQLPYGSEIIAPADVPDKDGNSFRGWGAVPGTMPSNDLVISGTYAANNYTVTFRIGDEVFFTGQQPFGSEIIVPEVPDKEGYSFTGWGDVPATVPAHDLDFVGTYAVRSYQLTFVIGDEVIFSEKVDYGAAISVPEAPYKVGHSFSGWGVVPAAMPASDLTLHGSYELSSHSVVFRIGDEIIYAARMLYGSDVYVPEAPAREGHSFAGWGNVPVSMPDEDMVFEGSYTVDSFVLKFIIDGEVVFSEKLEYGASIEAPEAPARKGHSFGGWGVVPSTMPASDLEITGLYSVNVYTAVFRIDETLISSVQLPYGAEIIVPEAPSREGHTFLGWGDVPAVMPDSDLDFNGGYAVDSYNAVYRIGPDVIAEFKVPFGAEIPVPQAPEKTGYTFAGWGIVPSTMPASDLEFSGAYDVNYFNVVFLINDEVVYSAQLPYGADIVAPEVTVYDGFEFKGWSEYPSTVPDHDVTVTGVIEEAGTTGFGEMEHGNGRVNICSPDGILLFRNVKVSDIKERLAPGVYIINGRKTLIR